jgi:branched-chain amino acid transport system permease protein
MELLQALFVSPFFDMWNEPAFFVETFTKGLLTGVLYSLVALGFVLIFKASGVFNFAQGVMALFAALTLVGLLEFMQGRDMAANHLVGMTALAAVVAIALLGLKKVKKINSVQAPYALLAFCAVVGVAFLLRLAGLPNFILIPLAIAGTVITMIALAYLIEIAVLRPLVNQELIILFMSTLGLAYVLEGVGDLLWGSDVKILDIGLPNGIFTPNFFGYGEVYIDQLDVVAAVVATLMVLVLAIFFNKTRIGRALRAVADDHQAAMSVGIPLKTIWVIVWSVAGLVALVAGVMWGSSSGVQFSLSLIALKALPVLILGGFTSIPGAIVGGLIIGVSEKLAEVFWYGLHGGAVENWFAFFVALAFLLFRPQGLFGEKIIERI